MLMGVGKVVRPSQREVIRQTDGGRRGSLRWDLFNTVFGPELYIGLELGCLCQ